MGTLTIICNWCKPARVIGTKPTDGADGITNTICERHAEEMSKQIDELRGETCPASERWKEEIR
jgi:hypothetical protein